MTREIHNQTTDMPQKNNFRFLKYISRKAIKQAIISALILGVVMALNTRPGIKSLIKKAFTTTIDTQKLAEKVEKILIENNLRFPPEVQ